MTWIMRGVGFVLLCAALLGATPATLANDTASEAANVVALIEKMFPKSTVIGDKETDGATPAWPVYQLNQVIGYAY
ncbi:MAG: hypothetical protein AAGA95_12890, partial [Pseudomonadota bacterium]